MPGTQLELLSKIVGSPVHFDADLPPLPRLLLVDDDDLVRYTLSLVLQRNGFHVTSASSVNEALKCIAGDTFDVLLSDLHMPQAGDGLTVVSAMRHSNPQAITLIFSGYPEMKQATAALLLQADGILVKPLTVDSLVKSIRDRLVLGAARHRRFTVSPPSSPTAPRPPSTSGSSRSSANPRSSRSTWNRQTASRTFHSSSATS